MSIVKRIRKHAANSKSKLKANSNINSLFPFQQRYLVVDNPKCSMQDFLGKRPQQVLENELKQKQGKIIELKDKIFALNSDNKPQSLNSVLKPQVLSQENQAKLRRLNMKKAELEASLGETLDCLKFHIGDSNNKDVKDYSFKKSKLKLNASGLKYIRAINLNIFSKSKLPNSPLLKKNDNIERRSHCFFYPNKLATHIEERTGPNGSYPCEKIMTDDKGGMQVETLQFLFLDFDEVTWEKISKKLKKFLFQPDVIVQSGGDNCYHLYWSLSPLKGTDSNVSRYEALQEALIDHLKADVNVKGAREMLRIPNTLNFKPKKRRVRKAKYRKDSRTLQEALSEPLYDLSELEETMYSVMGNDSDEGQSEQASEPPKAIVDLMKNNTSEADIEFNFEEGCDEAFHVFQRKLKLKPEYFTENDILLFNYLWKNRFRKVINFQDGFRKQLNGGGSSASHRVLNESIDKIARAGFKIKFNKLITKTEEYVFNGKNRRKAGYTLSNHFHVACGIVPKPRQNSRAALKEIIKHDLYKAGERYRRQFRDVCYLLSRGFLVEEIEELILEKTEKSSKQPNGCQFEVSNLAVLIKQVAKKLQ